MRSVPTILHLDMDAFYAAAEQASKPSLRGKPVVVGGIGTRGVVATASYEARRFGVHSAMPVAQARRLCPNAAYLNPRFTLYRAVSDQVMELLGRLSPLVEPLSLDEAFVDLEAGGVADDAASARRAGERLRADIRAVTGLTGSVGLAGSKMLAKIASEQGKPDGLVLIEPGTERELLAPMPVRILPGVGPATGEHLRRAGMTTVVDLAEAGEDELVRLLGKAHGASLYRMASGHDDRPVVSERDAKSVSVEDTFEVDLHDRVRVRAEVVRLADRCVERLRAAGRSGRTVVLKVRRYDFSTLTRSETLRGPTDDPAVVREAAGRLLESVDTTGGVRLLGVGVTGLADYTQEDLFAQAATERAASERAAVEMAASQKAADGEVADVEAEGSEGKAGEREPYGGEAVERAAEPPAERRWHAGHDVRHAEHGAGWVQGSGLGRVTVRFEEPTSAPGWVRTFKVDDPALQPSDPLPLVRVAEEAVVRDEPGGIGVPGAVPLAVAVADVVRDEPDGVAIPGEPAVMEGPDEVVVPEEPAVPGAQDGGVVPGELAVPVEPDGIAEPDELALPDEPGGIAVPGAAVVLDELAVSEEPVAYREPGELVVAGGLAVLDTSEEPAVRGETAVSEGSAASDESEEPAVRGETTVSGERDGQVVSSPASLPKSRSGAGGETSSP